MMTVENIKIERGIVPASRARAMWLATGCLVLAVVGWSWNPTPFAQALAAVMIAVALVHASISYGFGQALVFFLTCNLIAFVMENVGVATSFPFGHYRFAIGADLPHVGAIPVIVGPLWFGMGYFSWIVAATLLDGADRHLGRTTNLIALPVVAAFVMTQWDVVMDPSESTIAKAWIWHDGGADFGVPLSNFCGWLLTSWLFYQTFALYLRRQRATAVQGARLSRKWPLIAILFYLSAGLTQVTPWLMGQSGAVADAAGHVWRIEELRETTVVVMMFTMAFTAMLATLRLAKASG